MGKRFIFSLLGMAVIFLFEDCRSKSRTEKNRSTSEYNLDTSTIPLPDFDSSNFFKVVKAGDATFTVRSPNSIGDNYVIIHPSGLGIRDSITTVVDGRVTGAFASDLNNDGFPEIFFTVISPTKELNIYGYSDSKTRILTPIYMMDIDQDKKRGRGHISSDQFRIEGDRLLRSFPIYNESDRVGSPTGGTRTITYKLETGIKGWVLKATDYKDT